MRTLRFVGLAFLLTACASKPKPSRPRPAKLDTCAELAERIRARDSFYSSLRGGATLTARGRSVDLETALVSGEKLKDLAELRQSGLARIELVGPLGIRLGLVVLNPRWLYVFSISERTVYRFPAEELRKDTLRREALFAKLPVRISPDLFFLTFLGRVGLPDSAKAPECDFDPDEVAYRVRLPDGERGGRIVWVEPWAYYPLKALRFEGELPAFAKIGSEAARPASTATYDRVLGEGPASLPSRIQVRLEPSGETLEFLWRRAEAWPNVDVSVFEWEPPAALKIIDL